MFNKIAIVGAGSWATALSLTLARHHPNIQIWARREEQAWEINELGENRRYLAGIKLPGNIKASTELEEVLSGAGTVLFGVPSHAFREVLRLSKPLLSTSTLVINTAKGLEEDTLMRLSEVFRQEMGEQYVDSYVILSGPSHAEEVALKIPTAVVVASSSIKSAQTAQDIFMDRYLRVYTNPDVTGIELGGALKNVIALGSGIADGLQFGDNTIAALITRGLAEIARLGIKMGSNPLTFTGLAGVGDLIVTCTSKHSRNRRAGREIGQGKSVEEALRSVNMVVEGVRTTRVATALAKKHKVEMPITEQMYKVLFEDLSPRVAVTNLLNRGKRHEMEDLVDFNMKY